jgi:hypothetical protein
MKLLTLFSIFAGHFCPPGSGSRFRIRRHLRIYWPDWIRIRSTGLTLAILCGSGSSLVQNNSFLVHIRIWPFIDAHFGTAHYFFYLVSFWSDLNLENGMSCSCTLYSGSGMNHPKSDSLISCSDVESEKDSPASPQPGPSGAAPSQVVITARCCGTGSRIRCLFDPWICIFVWL